MNHDEGTYSPDQTWSMLLEAVQTYVQVVIIAHKGFKHLYQSVADQIALMKARDLAETASDRKWRT